jgi:hypothetical protein
VDLLVIGAHSKRDIVDALVRRDGSLS